MYPRMCNTMQRVAEKLGLTRNGWKFPESKRYVRKVWRYQGRVQGGRGAPGARPPKIGENKIFLRKIVIFHTQYPKNFRAYLRSAQFFLCAPPPNLKSWIRPWILKGYSEAVNGIRTDNAMANRKRTKGQTTIYKTLHRTQLYIEQHEPHWRWTSRQLIDIRHLY